MMDIVLFALFALAAGSAVFLVLRAYRAGGGARRAWATGAGGAAALGALALYAVIGSPALPGEPYAERIGELKRRPVESYTDAEMLARLAAEARETPTDPRPHFFAGMLYAQAGDDEQAARAFEASLRRDPTSAPAMLNLGRVLVRLDQGRVNEQAQRLFAAAAQAVPEDPTPWLYQALAATQAGQREAAARLWREVLQRLGPDDPRRAMAERMIADSEREGPGREGPGREGPGR